MGRFVLLTVLVSAVTAACAPGEPGELTTDSGDDPHRWLTCSACHEYTDLGTQTRLALEQVVQPDSVTVRAPAPEARCAAAGCHEDLGPREVLFPPVSFDHRRHGGDTIVVMGCAGCHGHDQGREPLTASVDPCSLCHLGEQSAGNRGECRICHTDLEHAGQTSQGLPVPHEGLPWVDGGCVRCHYDVTPAPTSISILTCRTCHDPDEAAVARGIGEDLHESHAGVGCTSCHEGETHHIQAMSTAVALECHECHQETHGQDVSGVFPGSRSCNACHDASHAPQQRLLLGLISDVSAPEPSEKFLDGLTCRSCHVPTPGARASSPTGGSGQGCTGCHRSEFRSVLSWWEAGAAERVRLVRSALARAGEGLAESGAARARLDSASALVDLVESGGAVHNLALSHRLLVRASDQVNEAWLAAGRSPPPPPELGREPRMGLCSYCHYRMNDPWLFEDMPGDFHREVLRLP